MSSSSSHYVSTRTGTGVSTTDIPVTGSLAKHSKVESKVEPQVVEPKIATSKIATSTHIHCNGTGMTTLSSDSGVLVHLHDLHLTNDKNVTQKIQETKEVQEAKGTIDDDFEMV